MAQGANSLRFYGPEVWLAVFRKNFRNGAALLLYNVVIQINKRQMQQLCQHTSQSGFAAAHESA